jgi:hypothetical protein
MNPPSSAPDPGAAAPVRLAPADGVLPPALAPSEGDPTVLLLFAAPEDPDWAVSAAVAIAGAWARAGRRVVLADLHLEEPRLHQRLGEQNLDGVVDSFLYGASLARTARPVSGHGFYLIPAGTYTADPDTLYRHPRWTRVIAGFAEANAWLMLFAPRDAAPALSGRIGSTAESVLLGGDGAPPAGAPPVRAHLLPPERASPGAPPPPTRPLEIAVEEHTAVGAALPPHPQDAPERRPDPIPASHDEVTREPPPRRSRGVAPLVWALLAATLLVGGAYALLRLRQPEGGAERPTPAVQRTPTAAAVAVPRARSVGVPLPFSVQTKAFTSLEAARDQLLVEQRRFSDVPFFVSPEQREGILYYIVLAGLAADTAEAGALRAELVRVGSVYPEEAAPGAWSLIKDGSLAFDLGDYPSQIEAAERADSLFRGGVPSYPVAVPFSDGSERWRLYGGAFRDSVAAEGMRGVLSGAGLAARLVPRVGRGTADVPAEEREAPR